MLTAEEKLALILKLIDTEAQYASGMASYAALKKEKEKQTTWTEVYNVLARIRKELER